MLESNQTLPDFQETYGLYGGRRLETSEEQELQEVLNFQDQKSAQTKMNELASGCGIQFLSTSEDSPQFESETYERGNFKRTNMKIAEEILDPDIPLRVVIYKDFVVNAGLKSERIRICLDKGSENQPVGVIQGIYSRERGFDINHRYVEPKYRRKQGVGSMLLDCIESFTKSLATGKQEEVNIFAEVAQLDVIYWLWKNGYKPENKDDWEKMDMIINGDGSLCMSDNLYVFEKDVPEDERYEKGSNGQFLMGNGKRSINPKRSFLLKMMKKFKPDVSTEVKDIKSKVRDSLKF